MKSVFLTTLNVVTFRESMGVLEDADRGQPGLAVVWGRAGRGKTLCAREYAVRTGAVYLRVMEDWTPRAMLSALCREVNGTEPRTVERCKQMACEALEHSQRVVLVDEADRLKVGLIEHFRDVHDMSGAPIVLIGEEHLFAMLSARRRLWSRVTQTVEFGPVSAEDVMLFGLKAAELKIDPAAAQKLTTRATGDFRLVRVDMVDLEKMCRANGVQKVDAKMIDQLPARKIGPRATIQTSNGGRQS